MILLVISPDFISHYSPLAVVAQAAKRTGHRVIVATGLNMASQVQRDGFEWQLLQLGASSNSGIVDQNPAIQRFLNATKQGAIPTIRCQAEDREKDLLWQPVEVAKKIAILCDDINPDKILVDHISFGSTLGVYATGRPFVTLVPGHPSQLPVGDERYGIPCEWPKSLIPSNAELAAQHQITDRVTGKFTERFNAALKAVAPDVQPVKDAFRVHGEQVLYNSLESYQNPKRTTQLPTNHAFIGPLIREETLSKDYQNWLDAKDDKAIVYVALGTFLSHRIDVLKALSSVLQTLNVKVAMAIGANPKSEFEPLPADWLIKPSLPQVGLLKKASLIIHHGGNNSLQEALGMGVRQLILPFSTDQFANAADLERTGQALVASPNDLNKDQLVAMINTLLSSPKPSEAIPASSKELVAALNA